MRFSVVKFFFCFLGVVLLEDMVFWNGSRLERYPEFPLSYFVTTFKGERIAG